MTVRITALGEASAPIGRSGQTESEPIEECRLLMAASTAVDGDGDLVRKEHGDAPLLT